MWKRGGREEKKMRERGEKDEGERRSIRIQDR